MTCFVEIGLSIGTRPASYFRAGMFCADGLFHCSSCLSPGCVANFYRNGMPLH